MIAEECPLTELPPEQCACKNHRGGDDPHEVETHGPVFEAQYDGWCERCHRAVSPGQNIVRVVDSAYYAHERCGET